MNKAKLDWIENAAIENLKSRQANIDQITSESHTTLTIAFSAIGVVFAFAVQNVHKDNDFFYAASATAIYLILTVLYLVSRCLIQEDFPNVYNEPKNLDQPGYTLLKLRGFELENIQGRIEIACAIIERRSNALNNVRKAIALFPILSFIVWYLISHLQ